MLISFIYTLLYKEESRPILSLKNEKESTLDTFYQIPQNASFS